MAEPARAEPRYRAFLSYSHKDADEAARIHRRLEGYRLPRRLVGRETDRGPVPPRLWPIFRDREELAASADLSETVRAALAESGALVVLCSPAAAASLWVAEEIATFRALHPDRPVLAAIIAGEPPDCFPAPLRGRDPDGAWHEPLATDMRRERDGPHLGLLKLVAGLTGVGLDDLVQRDASRRIRRVTAVTGIALAAMLIMAALTAIALGARSEADRQRAEAEGLIEFMLTDLRDRLKGVGRLDALTAVNERALAYYGRDELSELSVGSLLRRSRILHAMGDDDLYLGRAPSATAAFQQAYRTTWEQLARDRDSPEAIFAHSQSEYWIGYIGYRSRNFGQARAAWSRYRDLAERLVAREPGNPDWIREAGYAHGNLCTALIEGPGDKRAALHECRIALRHIEEVRRLRGDTARTLEDMVTRHAWLADAWSAHGRMDRVLFHKTRQEEFADLLLQKDPTNADHRDVWARTHLTIGEILIENGRGAEARRHVEAAFTTFSELHARDPANRRWIDLKRRSAISRGRL